ncbi:BCCT family transporter [Gilvimarinus xylanilyticus]|uniref:Choline BCCT transporter BetT n=1 Tax=Gilvimarinus xylanilyticus TaxID=2944139 RepID=A0A9X2HVS2_9GAMM|nr:choline BCCT transporter BetT [Gilvimarinus xylanilyticus]MCP8897909.1 choline BCCT transporter BetT [Gilvimarinus xylanilyticus]
MSEQDNPSQSSNLPPWIKVNPPVFFGAGGLCLLFVLFAVLAPTTAETVFTGVQNWVVTKAGWFYVLAVAIFLIFVIVLALSDYGRIKLGPDHSEPDYSYLSWFAMLFSAGMGIGLMFFGVAEPVMHTMSPPVGDPASVEAAREAMRITFFHWGMHAWAIYAVVALSLAYFAFRHNLPLTIRSAFYPLIGEKIHGPIGHSVDIFAVLGTLFGVATSLGFGVMQVNAGLNYLFEVPIGTSVQIILIGIITIFATISVVMGLDGGIRRVSELNLILAVVLLLFVLVAGPTVYLLQTYVQNVGYYLSKLVETTFQLYAYEPSGWIGGWTLFYWGWWIAWSPFVGMFIARVSRGRSIREFVIGVLMVPVGFTFMWMTFFGNTGIHMILDQGITQLADAVAADTSVALFQFFEYLPFTTIASLIATVLVITFFVTSSDSGSLVVDMLTSGGTEEETPVWQRIFWSVTEGVIASALLVAGGLQALQTATIASALPFTVVMLLMCWGMFKALRLEIAKRVSLRDTMLAPRVAQNPVTWEKRLSRIVHHPGRNEVLEHMEKVIRPALAKVAHELKQQGLGTEVAHDEKDRLWIEVNHGEEADFFYSVHVRPYTPPTFIMRDTSSKRGEKLRYYRAEVYLKEGGQDYDVMDWTEEQVIADVLDQYEKHMHFLAVVR